MTDSIPDGRALPDELLRVNGPHCPVCGGTRWVDPAFSECASCRWVVTDPVPMPEAMRPEPLAANEPASRLERLVFALIAASPASPSVPSYSQNDRSSIIRYEALYLEQFLRDNVHD